MSAPSSGIASLRAALALIVATVSLAAVSLMSASTRGHPKKREVNPTFQFECERVERARVAAQDRSHLVLPLSCVQCECESWRVRGNQSAPFHHLADGESITFGAFPHLQSATHVHEAR